MGWLQIILLLVGGVLASAALIVSKAPDAKKILDKLVPSQAVIGVALLGVSLVNLLRIGPINIIKSISHTPMPSMALLLGLVGGIVLGFFFGMPQIAKWIPGDSPAEAKAQELSAKIAPFQLIIGILCAICGLVLLLLTLKIIKPY